MQHPDSCRMCCLCGSHVHTHTLSVNTHHTRCLSINTLQTTKVPTTSNQTTTCGPQQQQGWTTFSPLTTKISDTHQNDATRAVATGCSSLSNASMQQSTPHQLLSTTRHPKHDTTAQAADAACDQSSSGISRAQQPTSMDCQFAVYAHCSVKLLLLQLPLSRAPKLPWARPVCLHAAATTD